MTIEQPNVQFEGRLMNGGSQSGRKFWPRPDLIRPIFQKNIVKQPENLFMLKDAQHIRGDSFEISKRSYLKNFDFLFGPLKNFRKF